MIISKKFDEATDLEKNVINYFKNNFFDVIRTDAKFWIAGGSIANKMTGNYSDFDFFFKDEIELNKVKDCLLADGGILQFESKTADHIKWKNKDLDLVRHYSVDTQACIESFDFTVSMVGVDSDGIIYYDERFYEHLAHRALIINKITYPLSTFKRVLKYQKKGYHICNAGIEKIMKAYKDIDTTQDEANIFYLD
jgi:hypothetical protein